MVVIGLDTAQVERPQMVGTVTRLPRLELRNARDVDIAPAVPHRLEASRATRLGLVGVDRERVVGAAARVDDVIGEAAEGPGVRPVDEVEDEGLCTPMWGAAPRAAPRRGTGRRPRHDPGPVGRSGTGTPLHVSTCRAGSSPSAETWSRSTEEST